MSDDRRSRPLWRPRTKGIGWGAAPEITDGGTDSRALPRQESVGRQGRPDSFVAWRIRGHRLRGRKCPVPEEAHVAIHDLELRRMKTRLAHPTAVCTGVCLLSSDWPSRINTAADSPLLPLGLLWSRRQSLTHCAYSRILTVSEWPFGLIPAGSDRFLEGCSPSHGGAHR